MYDLFILTVILASLPIHYSYSVFKIIARGQIDFHRKAAPQSFLLIYGKVVDSTITDIAEQLKLPFHLLVQTA